MQPSIGDTLKDNGQETVLSNTPDAYKAAVATAIQQAGGYGPFTSDDVQDVLEFLYHGEAVHPNALPALISGAAKRKQIKATGDYRRTKRPAGHSHVIAVWQLVQEGGN